RRHAVQRRAHDLVGVERRVAAAREAGDLDVRAGLAAGGLGPHAGRDLQQVGGAARVVLLDLRGGGGGDRVAGVDLAHACGVRRTGDDDLLQRLHGLAVLRVLVGLLCGVRRGRRAVRGLAVVLRQRGAGGEGGRDRRGQGQACEYPSAHVLTPHQFWL